MVVLVKKREISVGGEREGGGKERKKMLGL